MADVARWTQANISSESDTAGRLVDWLEVEYAGASLLLRLGPRLTEVAGELGLFERRR